MSRRTPIQATTLIRQLQAVVEKHGDLPVWTYSSGYMGPIEVQKAEYEANVDGVEGEGIVVG